jgi:hypothetical protein
MSKVPQPAIFMLKGDPDDPEAIEFFRRLGMCICSWAFIDRRMYQIFHHATGLKQQQSALFFYLQRAFNSRLRLVDDALRVFLPPHQFQSEWSGWKDLRDALDYLSHVRNIFAHHPPMKRMTTKDGAPFNLYTIHIEPYERLLNSEYPGLPEGKRELGVEDLKEHEAELEKLEQSLHNFAWVVGGLRAAANAVSTSESHPPSETFGHQ